MALGENLIIDYISNSHIQKTREEIDAVQPFLKQLVEDYGYEKDQIMAHPQFRVRKSPSGSKSFPVDIAIFKDNNKIDENLFMIVECKEARKKTGISQLKDYLIFSNAELGVWYNGNNKIFIRKYFENGKLKFKEIPNIPKKGQSINEIGNLKKTDLKPAYDLKLVFKTLRNYLAGNNTGTTRDEQLAKQIINLIFCKLYDEKYTRVFENLRFRASINESNREISNRIKSLFNDVKREYSDVFDNSDKIELDEKSIAYVVGSIQQYSLINSNRDAVADAFEVFIGRALKGENGQFFTPRNVVQFMINYLSPKSNDLIIDPACGTGGFLIESVRHSWREIENKAKDYDWNLNEIDQEKQKYAFNNVRGIDKDMFLSKVAKAYMTIIGDGKSGIFCDNSLINDWRVKTKENIKDDSFDIVLTNPPFGSKIPIDDPEVLKNYELGYKWEYKDNLLERTNSIKKSQPPQILFIERCINLLKNKGKMGIILPEGIFGNASDKYIWEWLKSKGKILAVISLSAETFQPHTHNKTSILFFEKNDNVKKDYYIQFATVENVGHDKNGKILYSYDELGNKKFDENNNFIINDEFKEIQNKLKNEFYDSKVFKLMLSDIINNIYIPGFYIGVKNEIEKYEENEEYEVLTIKNLIDKKIIYSTKNNNLPTGDEIGSIAYSLGDEIPFVRSSEIKNWEISLNTTKKTSRKIYEEKYKMKQNVEVEDILLVKDGTFLIGNTAMVTKMDREIIIQSHLFQIKVLQNEENITSFLMMHLLNSEIVQRQINAYTFIQGTLSTLGNRIYDIKLPFPKNFDKRIEISQKMEEIILKRSNLKEQLSNLKGDSDITHL